MDGKHTKVCSPRFLEFWKDVRFLTKKKVHCWEGVIICLWPFYFYNKMAIWFPNKIHFDSLIYGGNAVMFYQVPTRSEVFAAVKIQVEIFWIVTPRSVVVGYQRFERPFCHHLQGACTCETSVSYHNTRRRHKPEDLDLSYLYYV
jgi:hypothetical protein